MLFSGELHGHFKLHYDNSPFNAILIKNCKTEKEFLVNTVQIIKYKTKKINTVHNQLDKSNLNNIQK